AVAHEGQEGQGKLYCQCKLSEVDFPMRTNAMRLLLTCLITLALAPVSWGYTSASKHLDEPEAWYRSDDAAKMAANVLSWQATLGGWPKNIDTGAAPYDGEREKLQGTFDNGATTFE